MLYHLYDIYSKLNPCESALNIDLKDDESSAICTGGNPVIYSVEKESNLKVNQIQQTVEASQRFGEQGVSSVLLWKAHTLLQCL